MDKHWCACGREVADHDARCYIGAEPHSHIPPLCCTDCPCQSAIEAHPELLVSAGPNRWGTKTHPGDLVIVTTRRYAGRPGRILREVSIPAGHTTRTGFEVDLFPTATAQHRLVRVWPSSTEPTKVREETTR